LRMKAAAGPVAQAPIFALATRDRSGHRMCGAWAFRGRCVENALAGAATAAEQW